MPVSTKIAPKRTPLSFLGLCCAVGVSTIYYSQPLLLEMGRTFHVSAGRAGLVAVATQVGYALGLLFFVPMGDIFERRALMMRLYGAVAIALLLVAFAPTLALLVLGSVLIGTLASVTHIALPIAPDLAPEGKGGRAIGIVMTGLLLGVLLARTFAGWIADIASHLTHYSGWRAVFLIAALMNAAFVPAMWRYMPRLPPKHELSYADAMRSLWTVWRTQPRLRESCVMGALIFGSFSCFWNTLAFLLGTHGLGAGVAGTFGVVGAAGAMMASFAGRAADRRGPRWVLSVGIAMLTVAYFFLWLSERAHMSLAMHLVALAICVIVLDIGAQMSQIANQTRIFSLVPGARSRVNTVYMVIYFAGAAIGSALSTIAWEHFQWNGVCGLALAMIGLAALRHVTGIPDKDRVSGDSDHTGQVVLEA